jgi:serine/threonine protein kinase
MSERLYDGAGDDPVDEIVASCLESPPESVDVAVSAACSSHPEHAEAIRRRISALRDLGLVGVTATDDESFPERLGGFRLLRRLGGGGMGVVYVARQEQLGRDVALKLIRPEHLYFPRARERFRRETEAVARLQHAGIVPIYTVGEERGLPYFAMELVDGCTLAEAVAELRGRAPESLRGADLRDVLARRSPCDARGPAPERSALFEGTWVETCIRIAVQVAAALHHAHGRGVLHRDVKPSNIAVTRDGRAMLLDFGLASLEQAQAMTQSGSQLGSLLYMPPEQIRGDASAVDQRSDVYSLGVTLYELLTLQVPYYDTNPIGTRAAILDGRPDPLRARNRAVPKDLEVVCTKAMESDAAQRYADAGAFARDLENVLALRPIEARPPSGIARARRWVQRKPASAAALVLGFALVVGTPTALYLQKSGYAAQLEDERDAARSAQLEAEKQRGIASQAERVAQAERDKAMIEARDAEGVADFMIELFGAADPANAKGREVTAGDLLDLGVERIERELADQPDVQARLLERMGQSYTSLGRYADAEPVLRRSLELRTELSGERSLEVARSLFALGHLHRITGAKDAVELMQRAVAIRGELGEPVDDQHARCLAGLAMALSRDRRFDESLEWYERAMEAGDALGGDPRRLRCIVLANRASTMYQMRRFEAAIDDARAAIALEREMSPDPHPGLIASLNTLALALANLARNDEAREVYAELIALGARVHGDSSPQYATFVMNEAKLLEDLGDVTAARERLERALAIFERTAPEQHPQRLTCTHNLAGLCLRSREYPRARELYERALPLTIEREGTASPRTAYLLQNLGLACEAVGDAECAELRLREALASYAAQASASAPRCARVRAYLGNALRRDPERRGEAVEAFEAALGVARDDREEPYVAVIALTGLAAIDLAAGEDAAAAQARARLADALERAARFTEPHWASAFARGVNADWLAFAGERERGAAEAADAADELERALGAAHPLALEARARAERLR